MLRFLSLALLGLTLLAETAAAQTTPSAKTKPARRMVSNQTPAARRADPLRGTNDNGAGQAGYAAPGEPITPPGHNGKNTPPYDGPAAPTKKNANTTLPTPK